MPFGLRVDMKNLCEFVRIRETFSQETLDSLVIITQKKHMDDKNYEKWEFNRLKEYIKDFTDDLHLPKNKSNIKRLIGASYEHIPQAIESDLYNWFYNQELIYDDQLLNNHRIIGLGHPHNWLFWNTFKLIDPGSAYLFLNPVRAPSSPPNISELKAVEKFHLRKQLVKDSYLASKHPEFIRALSSDFLEEFGIHQQTSDSNPTFEFIAVHWRFNIGDFFKNDVLNKNETEIGNKGVSNDMAKHLYRSMKDFTYFFDHLINYLEKNSKIKTILITSPINIARDISKISQDQNNKGFYKQYKIITTIDTDQYLTRFRSNCQVIDDYYGDVLSTLEKEIVLKSAIFIRSRPSNWSLNVQGHRFAVYDYEVIAKDSVIFEIFK